jgi:periplasmic protein CpxP/Spy
MRRTFESWVLALAVVVAGGSQRAIAQSGRGGGYQRGSANRVEAHLRRLGEQLSLTDGQKAKIKPILAQEGQQIRAIQQDSSIPQDQRIDRIKMIHQSFQPQILGILTPEQQEKYEQLEKEAQDKRPQNATSGDSNPTPRPQSEEKSDD